LIKINVFSRTDDEKLEMILNDGGKKSNAPKYHQHSLWLPWPSFVPSAPVIVKRNPNV